LAGRLGSNGDLSQSGCLAGVAGAFLSYTCICALSFFYIRAYLPETRHKTLEDIERHLKKQR
jgi:hypothetical protein